MYYSTKKTCCFLKPDVILKADYYCAGSSKTLIVKFTTHLVIQHLKEQLPNNQTCRL